LVRSTDVAPPKLTVLPTTDEFRVGLVSTPSVTETTERGSTAMGKIVITTNMSLDGVIEDPDGQEGFRLGGWFGQFGGKDLEAWAELFTAEAHRTDALLLGRRSDEWFATR